VVKIFRILDISLYNVLYVVDILLYYNTRQDTVRV
jgi:hypothetical protein